jgi:putative two-component system response regulator
MEALDERTIIERAERETVRRLLRIVEFRDDEAPGHVERMSRYAEVVARGYGLGDDSAERLRLASTLHDAGKIALPESILLAPGRLTAHQRKVMQQHTEVGYRLLAGSEYALLELAAMTALTHHERFDGNGYPRGLGGEEIPIAGRIAAVADVFDALTTERAYRPAFAIEEALKMMEDERGGQFDPDVLDAFLEAKPELHAIMEQHYGASFLGQSAGGAQAA